MTESKRANGNGSIEGEVSERTSRTSAGGTADAPSDLDSQPILRFLSDFRAHCNAPKRPVARRRLCSICWAAVPGGDCSVCRRQTAKAAPFVECDLCSDVAPQNADGSPKHPTSYGSKVGLCTWCAREAISL